MVCPWAGQDAGQASGWLRHRSEPSAIGQVVDGADVRSEGHGGMVEEARSIRFLGRFEFVDQAAQQFAVGLVTHLRGLHPFARANNGSRCGNLV